MTTFGPPDWPADGVEPLLEPGHLDVVGLVAVQRQPLDVVGHERIAVDLAAQAEVGGRRPARTRSCGTRRSGRRRCAGCRPGCPDGPAPGGCGRGRCRPPTGAGRRGSARSRPSGRRTRRPSSGRPTRGRSSTPPGPRPQRGTPRCSGSWPSGRAVGGPRRAPTVIGLPDRFASTVAPASAASALGGIGTHMSSHTSTCVAKPGRSEARKIRSGPNGTTCPATVMVPPRRSSPGANHRRS